LLVISGLILHKEDAMQVLKQFSGVIIVGLLAVLGVMSLDWTLVVALGALAVIVGLRYLGTKVSALSMLTTERGSAIANLVLAGGGGVVLGLTKTHVLLSVVASGVLCALLSEGAYNLIKKILFPASASTATTPAAPATSAPAAAPTTAAKK
jgi:hypothetical protein